MKTTAVTPGRPGSSVKAKLSDVARSIGIEPGVGSKCRYSARDLNRIAVVVRQRDALYAALNEIVEAYDKQDFSALDPHLNRQRSALFFACYIPASTRVTNAKPKPRQAVSLEPATPLC